MTGQHPFDPRHRGAALLIVLAVLLVMTTATTIVVSTAANIRTQRHLTDCARIADSLLSAAETPIQHWLKNTSTSAVTPPDAAMPAFGVLRDQWSLSTGEGEAIDVHIAITAFDQRGMVPMHLARSGSPLRLSLPDRVLVQLDAMALPPRSATTPLGLDLFDDKDLRDGDSASIFPGTAIEAPPAFGGLVATHNRDPVRINVSTAPMPLVESAMRLAGRGDVELVRIARSEGKVPALVQVSSPSRADSSAQASTPQIVTTSDCWAFRIDITVGPLRRAWWAIYTPHRQSTRDHAWMCVQRLPIRS